MGKEINDFKDGNNKLKKSKSQNIYRECDDGVKRKLFYQPLDDLKDLDPNDFDKNVYQTVEDFVEDGLLNIGYAEFRYKEIYYSIDLSEVTEDETLYFFLARYDKDMMYIDCVGFYTPEELATLPLYDGKTMEEILKVAEFWD